MQASASPKKVLLLGMISLRPVPFPIGAEFSRIIFGALEYEGFTPSAANTQTASEATTGGDVHAIVMLTRI